MRLYRCIRYAAPVCMLVTVLPAAGQSNRLFVPPEHTVTTQHLQQRAARQLDDAQDWAVRADFGFARVPQAALPQWRHAIVDDAGRDYKPVHYDHGNGLAAADVNGDGFTDLYFANQLGRNALWLNDGNGRFEDVTESANVAVADRISVGAAFADIDNDGDADLYVTTVRGGNLLFENDGSGTFVDISARSGADYRGHSSGSVFFDYDRDGLLDLFVSNVGIYTGDQTGRGGYFVGFPDAFSGHLISERTELSRLYRNLGDNRFEDVTEAAGLIDSGWTGDALPIDVNADGWTDLYATNMQGLDRLWINQGGTGFTDESGSLLPRSPWGSMGIDALDFENDGDFDIAVSDMHSDMTEILPFDQLREKQPPAERASAAMLADSGRSLPGNAFYVTAEGRLEEAGSRVGIDTFWPWGISAGDINADGYEDLFITGSMNFPYRYGVNSVLLNENGSRFRDAEFVLGIEPRAADSLYTPWFEVDCAIDAHEVCRVTGSGEAITVMASIGSRSSVILDVDSDGDLDIVTSEFNQPPIVWVSNLAATRDINYVSLELQGTRDNRQGLGAALSVWFEDGTHVSRLNNGKSGYLSQSALPIYIAAETETAIERIEVRWPNEQVQVVYGPVETGAVHRIIQPD